DFLNVGQDFVLREFIRSLSNLQMLFAQVLHGENLVSRMLFNQKASAYQFGLVRNCYGRHIFPLLLTTKHTKEHEGHFHPVPSTTRLIPSFRCKTLKLIMSQVASY